MSYPPLLVRRLGRVAYAPAEAQMRAFTSARDAATQDELWLVEHPPVYTLGQAGRDHHLHDAAGVPVVRTERGGQVTYHGPGQVVAYVLVDLKRRGIKVREFVAALEDAAIATLESYNLAGLRKAGAPGVYVEHAGSLQKIAALGVKVKNGATYHGLALNVAMDLSPFSRIDPCGYPDLITTDLQSLGVRADWNDAADRLAAALESALAARGAPGDAPTGRLARPLAESLP